MLTDHPGASATTSRPYDDEVAPDVRFALLGRLEVIVAGRDVAPTTPRSLQLLALLLLQPGRVVPVDTIVEELWCDQPPRRARSAVQTHVYQLRQCMERVGVTTRPEDVLRTRPPGYVLEVDAARTDLHAFSTIGHSGTEALAEGRVDEAGRLLRAAEQLWTGPPLANVGCGAVLARESVELLERRRALRGVRIGADLDAGRHRELVGELTSLAVAHPFDEDLQAQLIRALGRCGRRCDAMAVFRRLRDLLDRELGVEPDTEVTEAYAELLTLGEDARAA